jgi:hypothetical protein
MEQICLFFFFSEVNIIAMRLGPGKHLQGRTLLGGVVEPDHFDYFYEVGAIFLVQLY